MPPPSVGHVAFPLVRTRCFTASPHLGVGASLVEEEERRGRRGRRAPRRNLPTHSHTPLFLCSSWQEWSQYACNLTAVAFSKHHSPNSPAGPPAHLAAISSRLKTSLALWLPFTHNLWPEARGFLGSCFPLSAYWQALPTCWQARVKSLWPQQTSHCLMAESFYKETLTSIERIHQLSFVV